MKLLVIRNQGDLTDYIFDSVSENQHIKVAVNKEIEEKGLKKAWQKALKYLAVHDFDVNLEHFFPKQYLNELQSYSKEFDKVLLFNIQNLKQIILYRKLLPKQELSVFLWNPAHTFCRNSFSKKDYIQSTIRKEIKVYTFDEKDAEEYGFNLIEQPFCKLNNSNETNYNADALFIGKDKGRSKDILQILNLLKDANLSYTCHILKDKHGKLIPELSDYYSDKYIDYKETLQLISQHRLYIEVLQKGQSGMTLRPLEALFQKRKLISTNKNLYSHHLFDSSRILIVEENTTADDVLAFINTPFSELKTKDIEQHEINHWLEQFLGKCDHV